MLRLSSTIQSLFLLVDYMIRTLHAFRCKFLNVSTNVRGLKLITHRIHRIGIKERKISRICLLLILACLWLIFVNSASLCYIKRYFNKIVSWIGC